MESKVIFSLIVIILIITVTVVLILVKTGKIKSSEKCEYEWSQWSECKTENNCGVGLKTRNFIITNEGDDCPDTTPIPETTICSLQPCPDNCIGKWGEWVECDKTCGGGKTYRTYNVLNKEKNGGNECPHKDGDIEEKECNTHACPFDCEGTWSDWGECSKTCKNTDDEANGIRNKTFYVQKYMIYQEGTTPTPKDCLSEDSDWPEDIPIPVGWNSGKGISNRPNEQLLETTGSKLYNFTEECETPRCPIDCAGSWGDWTPCTQDCHGPDGVGTQQRVFNVSRQKEYGGRNCLLNDREWNQDWWSDDFSSGGYYDLTAMLTRTTLNLSTEQLNDKFRRVVGKRVLIADMNNNLDYHWSHLLRSDRKYTVDEAKNICLMNEECGGFTIDNDNIGNYENFYANINFTSRDNMNVIGSYDSAVSFFKEEGLYNINTPTGAPDDIDRNNLNPDGYVQVRECNVQKCPIDCDEGWSNVWKSSPHSSGQVGVCSVSSDSSVNKYTGEPCGIGKEYDTWIINQGPQYGGTGCTRSEGDSRQRQCSFGECPVDCIIGKKEDSHPDCNMANNEIQRTGCWSACSTQNNRDSGIRSRRNIDLVQSQYGGKCPPSSGDNCTQDSDCPDVRHPDINGDMINSPQECVENECQMIFDSEHEYEVCSSPSSVQYVAPPDGTSCVDDENWRGMPPPGSQENGTCEELSRESSTSISYRCNSFTDIDSFSEDGTHISDACKQTCANCTYIPPNCSEWLTSNTCPANKIEISEFNAPNILVPDDSNGEDLCCVQRTTDHSSCNCSSRTVDDCYNDSEECDGIPINEMCPETCDSFMPRLTNKQSGISSSLLSNNPQCVNPASEGTIQGTCDNILPVVGNYSVNGSQWGNSPDGSWNFQEHNYIDPKLICASEHFRTKRPGYFSRFNELKCSNGSLPSDECEGDNACYDKTLNCFGLWDAGGMGHDGQKVMYPNLDNDGKLTCNPPLGDGNCYDSNGKILIDETMVELKKSKDGSGELVDGSYAREIVQSRYGMSYTDGTPADSIDMQNYCEGPAISGGGECSDYEDCGTYENGSCEGYIQGNTDPGPVSYSNDARRSYPSEYCNNYDDWYGCLDTSLNEVMGACSCNSGKSGEFCEIDELQGLGGTWKSCSDFSDNETECKNLGCVYTEAMYCPARNGRYGYPNGRFTWRSANCPSTGENPIHLENSCNYVDDMNGGVSGKVGFNTDGYDVSGCCAENDS